MMTSAAAADPLACRASFCGQCGTLLPTLNEDELVCACCGNKYCYADLDVRNLRIATRSEPRNNPKWVQDRLTELGLDDSGAKTSGKQKRAAFKADEQKRAVVDENCPKCGHDRASFYTMQLRSVDEGQTVFYECLKCAHNWNQNN